MNHAHIYGMVDASCAAAASSRRSTRTSPSSRAEFARRYPAAKAGQRRARDPRGSVDPARAVVHHAERARAARHSRHAARQGLHGRQAGHHHAGAAGRGAPGAVGDEADLLDRVQRAVRECARRSARASWCKAGAIGKVIQTVGLGPHRIHPPARPDWFWDPTRYGGIICDIARTSSTSSSSSPARRAARSSRRRCATCVTRSIRRFRTSVT